MRLKALTLTTATITLLLLAGCSGGGGDSSFKDGATIIPVDVNCTSTTTVITEAIIATYIPLQSGDTLVKDDDNTSVKIYHDVNGIKKVCLESGRAHILR